MNRISTKAIAEAALRDLPAVLGAYVSEDDDGHPREIHLLIHQGPDTASLAREVRQLLEERLGVDIDQRIISIAQLDHDPDEGAGPRPDRQTVPERSAPARERPKAQDPATSRPRFEGLESTATSGRVRVGVRLEWSGDTVEGEGEAVDTRPGRARAAATATLRSAAVAPWSGGLDFELDFASIVQALDGEYVLVSALAVSPRLGRRPVPLVGVHPVDSDVESAAALATLKAINRVLSLAIGEP